MYINNPGHMTKMAAKLIYGKTLQNRTVIGVNDYKNLAIQYTDSFEAVKFENSKGNSLIFLIFLLKTYTERN